MNAANQAYHDFKPTADQIIEALATFDYPVKPERLMVSMAKAAGLPLISAWRGGYEAATKRMQRRLTALSKKGLITRTVRKEYDAVTSGEVGRMGMFGGGVACQRRRAYYSINGRASY